MKKNNKETFLKVDYDLLSSTELHSTQKLFIAYIIGWQRNKKVCRETNNNLATRFGMKYSGIRTLIRELNKLDFFQSVAFDYNKSVNTSGHEITVDETKLKLFLSTDKDLKIDGIEDTDNYEFDTKPQINQGELITLVTEIISESDYCNDKQYEIVIDSEDDLTHEHSLLVEYFTKYNEPTNYISAKITFDNEDDFIIDEVFELKNSKSKYKYVSKKAFKMFLEYYNSAVTE